MVRDRPANVADRLRAADILDTIAPRESELGRGEAGLEALRQARELVDADPARRTLATRVSSRRWRS